MSSAFPLSLYATVYQQGELQSVSASGQATLFASGLGASIDVAFNPDPSGPFGDFAYVTDPLSDTVLRVDPAGGSTVFASGFSFTTSGWGAEITFTPDGSTMFVSSGSDIVMIRHCLAPGNGQANSSLASLEIDGWGAGGCPGPHVVNLFVPGSVTLLWSGPVLAPVYLVAGPLYTSPVNLGWPGLLSIGSPMQPIIWGAPLDNYGRLDLVFNVPQIPQGPFLNLQGAVVQPPLIGPICPVNLTAAFVLNAVWP